MLYLVFAKCGIVQYGQTCSKEHVSEVLWFVCLATLSSKTVLFLILLFGTLTSKVLSKLRKVCNIGDEFVTILHILILG